MLTKTRTIPEHHVTVNEHLVRGFVELVKQAENAGKLTSVELPRYVARNFASNCDKFHSGFCVCIGVKKDCGSRCAFISDVMDIKGRDHYSPFLQVQRQYKAGHSLLSQEYSCCCFAIHRFGTQTDQRLLSFKNRTVFYALHPDVCPRR